MQTQKLEKGLETKKIRVKNEDLLCCLVKCTVVCKFETFKLINILLLLNITNYYFYELEVYAKTNKVKAVVVLIRCCFCCLVLCLR